MNEAGWQEVEAAELGPDGPGQGPEETEGSRKALTPKALSLLEKISEYGFLTMHEVHLVFGNKTWSYKVMAGLRSQGLVQDFDTLMHPRTGHHLTAKSYRVLVKFGRLRVGKRFVPERYTPFIFNHRMACAKVGLLLERHPLVHEFLPESLLWKRRKRDTDKVCDGEFWYKVQGHDKAEKVGLEVELSLKNSGKVDESFQQFQRRRDLDQVWWLCGDDNIQRALRREVQRWPSLEPQRHLFGLLEAFLAAKGTAELMEPRGAMLSIDPNRPTLVPRPPEPPPSSPAPLPAPEPTSAQAQAPNEPEPALSREGNLEVESNAQRTICVLRAAWRWIMDSWVEERYMADYYISRTRWRFKRWRLVLAALAIFSVSTGIQVWPMCRRFFALPASPAQRRLVKPRPPKKKVAVEAPQRKRCWWSRSPLEPDEQVPCDSNGENPKPTHRVDGMVEIPSERGWQEFLRRTEGQKSTNRVPRP